VGDSRCYLFRDGLRQLTTDHTVLQQMIDSGRMPLGRREDSLLGQALWNALGGSVHEVYVDITHVELQAGDSLLLCTDGLVRHVDDGAIGAALRGRGPAAAAARAL